MRRTGIANLALGFIAAAIAVITVHQAIVYILTAIGFLKGQPWSMKPMGPFGVPTIINQMFWGGLWGALFAVVWHLLPSRIMWVKGLLFGLLITLFSNWIFLPLIRGKIFNLPNQVLFSGGDPQRMLTVALIVGGFGAALGLIYGWIARAP
jgi:hypothetical protein